eukprot:scaffold666_cov48-Cyclotella_meneghiniana.AAC.1
MDHSTPHCHCLPDPSQQNNTSPSPRASSCADELSLERLVNVIGIAEKSITNAARLLPCVQ